ncbi:MAG TPA: SRPBCC family protein [Acidimicrobiia bacterium]|nr:SRPBCC family protein [Acidimicrobiia bacterium]
MRPFLFDRSWAFDVPADRLWEALTRTDDYRRWWPWLRELSGDGLVPGGRSVCVVRAPIPYALRFTVEIADLVPGERIEAFVEGDLTGTARLDVQAVGAGRGSQVRLSWEMKLQRPVLRAAARVGRPVMEWGHDWVVSTGFEQFCRKALRVQVPHDDFHDSGSGAAHRA